MQMDCIKERRRVFDDDGTLLP